MFPSLRHTASRIVVLTVLCLGQAMAAEEPLPPDEAFKFSASLKDKNTIVATIAVAKNHYLYKSKTRFALKNATGVMLNEIQMPTGEMKNDPNFGMMEVYRMPITVTLPLERSPKAQGVSLYATYQGCNEKLGICYPPIVKTVDMTFPK